MINELNLDKVNKIRREEVRNNLQYTRKSFVGFHELVGKIPTFVHTTKYYSQNGNIA